MALSEREQKLLEQMEQALYAEDPRFVTRISTGGGGSKRRMLIGVAGILVGLGLVVLSVLWQQVWVGALAFALMVAGGVFAFTPRRESGPTGSVASDGQVTPRPAKGKTDRASLMQRLEARWERRSRDEW